MIECYVVHGEVDGIGGFIADQTSLTSPFRVSYLLPERWEACEGHDEIFRFAGARAAEDFIRRLYEAAATRNTEREAEGKPKVSATFTKHLKMVNVNDFKYYRE